MLTAIYAILVFCVIILVHEFGHFAAAKLCRIKVNEFSLGMGPRLIHYQGKETEFSLRLLPIGGYNKIEGEDEDSDDPRSFNNASVWARILVVFSGALMNFLTCILILTLIYTSVGYTTKAVGELIDGYPAQKAGVLVGDEIESIDGKKVDNWNDVLQYTGEAGDEAVFVLNRDGEEITITVPLIVSESGQKMIGIRTEVKHNFFRAIGNGFTGTWEMAREMYAYIGGLFRGQGSMDDIAGPVGIVSIIADEAKLGFIYVANLTAIISLNLGIMNLLPFPALDGGRLVFLIINLITGKRVSAKVEGTIHAIGLMILLAFMLFVVVKDVARLL